MTLTALTAEFAAAHTLLDVTVIENRLNAAITVTLDAAIDADLDEAAMDAACDTFDADFDAIKAAALDADNAIRDAFDY